MYMYNINTSVIMKSILNYSKLAIATLCVSSAFVACSDEISETTSDVKYTANTGNITTVGKAVDLGLPSGTKWADMNVGAASASDNGILFVWGDITGTQVLPTTATSYTDVVSKKSVTELFNLYKGSTAMVGTVADTTNVLKSAEPMMIDLAFIGDTTNMDSLSKAKIDAQKMDKIISFVKAKLDLMKQANTGFLEASLANEDFALIIDWDGSKFIERFPSQKTERDTLDYFKKYVYASNTSLTIDVLGSTSVNYYEAALANNYTEIKDQFGVVMRKDYNGGSISGISIYNIIGDAKYDPATANWGGSWKMPSKADIQELKDKCTWEFEGSGYKVTGPNGNSIFLPAAGYRFGEKWYGNGNAGYYATGEILGSYQFPSMAEQINGSEGSINSADEMPYMLIFQHGQFVNSVDIFNNLSGSYGVSVRPVSK